MQLGTFHTIYPDFSGSAVHFGPDVGPSQQASRTLFTFNTTGCADLRAMRTKSGSRHTAHKPSASCSSVASFTPEPLRAQVRMRPSAALEAARRAVPRAVVEDVEGAVGSSVLSMPDSAEAQQRNQSCWCVPLLSWLEGVERCELLLIQKIKGASASR